MCVDIVDPTLKMKSQINEKQLFLKTLAVLGQARTLNDL